MKRNRFIIYTLIFAIGISLVIFIVFKVNKNKVDITKYNIVNEKIPTEFNGFKIVQLSDFHSKGYKETTEKIITKINNINPDIVVMTGDMISWELENIDEFNKLIKEVCAKFPVYYINGNHEQLAQILKKSEYDNFITEIKELGVVIINNSYIEVIKKDQSIRLYEIDIPLDDSTGLYITEEQIEDNYVENILSEIDSEKFNILLAHNPLFIDEYSKWGADLVLSGHIHGGIIRIPLINKGIISPEKELFPKYDAGDFKVGDTIMIVNRGIGSSSFDLRIFNSPEISVITLKNKQ